MRCDRTDEVEEWDAVDLSRRGRPRLRLGGLDVQDCSLVDESVNSRLNSGRGDRGGEVMNGAS